MTTLQLQRVYNGLLNSGKKNGKGLAVKTVRHVHGLVHIAMQTAVKWGLLKINPAHPCDLPPVPLREAAAMDQDGTQRFIYACADNWLRDGVRPLVSLILNPCSMHSIRHSRGSQLLSPGRPASGR